MSENLSKMHDLSKFEKRQIVGACMAGTLISKVAKLFVCSRATIISRTMTEFSKQGKTESLQETTVSDFCL